MLGNKIFRMKLRKTDRVRNKYEDNMEISLNPLAAFCLSTYLPSTSIPPISPPSIPSLPSPPLSFTRHTIRCFIT
jgi:hypothetical protein